MYLTNFKFNPINLLALGVIFITSSAIFFLAAYGAPAERSELLDFHGKASNIKETRGKYGVTGFEFMLETESQIFRFEAHGMEHSHLVKALKKLGNEKVRILAHPNGELSWFSGLRKLPVYAITIPGGPQISYEQFSRAWTEANSLSQKISGASAAIGVIFILLYFYYRAKPNQ